MSSLPTPGRRRATALLAEPTVHFFALGALLFLAHRLVVGDSRIVVVTPAVKAGVERHFRDGHEGRAPTAAELGAELRTWEREEALYREGLLGGLDRHDATIRTVVADRMRARVAIGISRPTPTAADLEAWLASHRGLYESPRRYEYGIVTFPGGDPGSRAAIERYEQAMNQGADARTLGRPIVGGDLTDEDLKARLGPALAARIESLPVGRWQRLESTDTLRLVRLDKISGGLPGAEALRSQMTADWTYAERQRLIGQAVDSIVDRYHFEVRP